jgi:predicted short-subunit dehydrogenase-like oxidoreductase (DUF2520 family)
MFQRIRVIGRGRLGSAVASRLEARGCETGGEPPELVVFCVPDGVIAETARALPAGPWVCHMSGATPLAACGPHVRRFTVHPLQTFRRGGGPEQFDGAWGAVSGDTVDARARGAWLALQLGLRPFELADDRRALYHAGATMASNYLVTLYRAATRAAEMAGAPPQALVPLMRRTVENGFELTGPIARGDWLTVDAHLRALQESLPELLPVYRTLAEATSLEAESGGATPDVSGPGDSNDAA